MKLVHDTPAEIFVDGQINVSDLNAVISAWGPCTVGAICIADVNGDCVIDQTDFDEVMNHLNGCGGSGFGLSPSLITTWSNGGGYERFQNGQITHEHIGEAMNHVTLPERVAALFELISQ